MGMPLYTAGDVYNAAIAAFRSANSDVDYYMRKASTFIVSAACNDGIDPESVTDDTLIGSDAIKDTAYSMLDRDCEGTFWTCLDAID